MSALEGYQEKDIPCATSTSRFANVDQLEFRAPYSVPLYLRNVYLQPRSNQYSSAKADRT
jgi:hypothetical protein